MLVNPDKVIKIKDKEIFYYDIYVNILKGIYVNIHKDIYVNIHKAISQIYLY